MNGRRPELLIPASNLEVLKVAVMFGADAVYIVAVFFHLTILLSLLIIFSSQNFV